MQEQRSQLSSRCAERARQHPSLQNKSQHPKSAPLSATLTVTNNARLLTYSKACFIVMRLILLLIATSTYRGSASAFVSRIAFMASDAASNWSTAVPSASAEIVLGPFVPGPWAVAVTALASALMTSLSATFSRPVPTSLGVTVCARSCISFATRLCAVLLPFLCHYSYQLHLPMHRSC